MRLRGYIVARSTIRGVDIHSQLRTIFIIATHQLNTRTTNPLPQSPQSSTPPLPSILPNPAIPLNPIPTYLISSYIIFQSSSIVRSSFATTYLPLFLIVLFPPIYTPILPYISPKTHTTLKLYLTPKRVFVIKSL